MLKFVTRELIIGIHACMGTGIVEYNENFCGSIERNVYPTCMEAATISYTVGYIHILPNAGIIIVSCVCVQYK